MAKNRETKPYVLPEWEANIEALPGADQALILRGMMRYASGTDATLTEITGDDPSPEADAMFEIMRAEWGRRRAIWQNNGRRGGRPKKRRRAKKAAAAAAAKKPVKATAETGRPSDRSVPEHAVMSSKTAKGASVPPGLPPAARPCADCADIIALGNRLFGVSPPRKTRQDIANLCRGGAPIDMMEYAVQITDERRQSERGVDNPWSYMWTVVNNWLSDGIRTLDDARREKEGRPRRTRRTEPRSESGVAGRTMSDDEFWAREVAKQGITVDFDPSQVEDPLDYIDF